MKWNEYQHAWIVSEYYKLLVEEWGEVGKQAFIQAANTYGEQRGKRMAMRAIRDGKPLNFESYFAYGEYMSTAEFFNVEMWCDEGVVNEKVTKCPWNSIFAKRGMLECGAVYCKEIDKAIVRGFSPDLLMKTESTQHFGPCCRFYFYHDEVKSNTLEIAENSTINRNDIIMPLSYHCVHVFSVFDKIVCSIFKQKGKIISEKVLETLRDEFGEEASEFIKSKKAMPFDTLLSIDEWENDNEN